MSEPCLIPVIETESLLLRPFSQDDLDPFAAILADPEVISGAIYTGKPMTLAQAVKSNRLNLHTCGLRQRFLLSSVDV